jgi:drug/metabolite transporter (DMT)-like permease
MNENLTKQKSQNLTGVFWMIVTGICFLGVTALVKFMGTRIPAAEAAFLRYALGLVLLLPMLKDFSQNLPNRKLSALFVARGIVHTVGVVLWFFAMSRIPLADVTAMNYMSPIYVTLGAAIFLGEPLALRRILAILLAIVGALLILRPGFREVSIGHLAVIFTAIFFAFSYLIAKHTSGKTTASVVVVMLSIYVTIGLAPLAFLNWVTPTWVELILLFAVAFFATAGHYTMTLAFAAAPISVTQPATFLQLVWAVLVGSIIFGEEIDLYVIGGGGLILCSITFMSWREAVIKRKAMTPTVPQTKV